MHHCAIEDPSNVVILNINGLELEEVKKLFNDEFFFYEIILGKRRRFFII